MAKLAKISAHLERADAFYLSAASRVPEDRWLEAPAQGGWSAAEISAHVAMIEERIVGRIAKILEKPAILTPFWKRFHLPVSLGASRRRRVKSPVPLDPSLVAPKNASLARISAARAATHEFMKGVAAKNLRGYRFPHPFLGSFSVTDWLLFVGYHQIRHAKQILELVEAFHN